jgi:hypothetical protein
VRPFPGGGLSRLDPTFNSNAALRAADGEATALAFDTARSVLYVIGDFLAVGVGPSECVGARVVRWSLARRPRVILWSHARRPPVCAAVARARRARTPPALDRRYDPTWFASRRAPPRQVWLHR